MKATANDIEMAINWLQVNEGAEGEAEACARVAAWLVEELKTRTVRKIAREAGVSVARARRALEEAR